jgi:hypothetical protein
VQPVLLSWSFPDPAQMRDGLGEIHIEYAIDYGVDSPPGDRNRRLILTNHHLNRTSVYLMNVLAPQDDGIQIVAQKRNEQQSLYELDYRIDAGAGTPWNKLAAWLSGIQFSSLFRLGMRHIAEGQITSSSCWRYCFRRRLWSLA